MSDSHSGLTIHRDTSMDDLSVTGRSGRGKGSTNLKSLLDEQKRKTRDQSIGIDEDDDNLRLQRKPSIDRDSSERIEGREKRKDLNEDAYNLSSVINAVKGMYDTEQPGKRKHSKRRGRDGLTINDRKMQELDDLDDELEGEAQKESNPDYEKDLNGDIAPMHEQTASGCDALLSTCSNAACLGCLTYSTDKCQESCSSLPLVGPCMHSMFDWCGLTGRSRAFIEMQNGVVLLPDHKRLNEPIFKQFWKNAPSSSVLSIRIEKTSMLEPHLLLIHPMVRMYVVNLVTGQYWKKSDPNRAVIAPFENNRAVKVSTSKKERIRKKGGKFASEETEMLAGKQTPEYSDDNDDYSKNDDYMKTGMGAINHILPVMTPPCHLRSLGAFSPVWNDEIMINEPLDKLMKPECLLLFEILDFGKRVNLNTHPDGLFPVAWGFFKLVSNKGIPNCGNVEIQLFRHTSDSVFLEKRRQSDREHVPDVYYDWVWQKNTHRILYPASLSLTILAAPSHETRIVAGNRPQFPTDKEIGRINWKFMTQTSSLMNPSGNGITTSAQQAEGEALAQTLNVMSVQQKRAIARQRSPIDACELPDTKLHTLSVGERGAYALAFSPDGTMLAAACGEKLMFTIKLFNTETGELIFTYSGHHDIIYDLSWSSDSCKLVSASSDNSAKIWNVKGEGKKRNDHSAERNLQHSCFVYTAKYHPTAHGPSLVITGAYDGIIRIWNTRSAKCVIALSNHETHVNSICFAPNGSQFYSADADGIIKIWEDTAFTSVKARREAEKIREGQLYSDNNRKTDKSQWKSRFKCLRTMAHKQLRGDSINCLQYHNRPERLVAYTRGDSIYSFSFLRYEIQRQLNGARTTGRQLKCSISPDGKYLVAGSADGKAYFWDLYTGRLEKTLDVGYHLPMCDVVWHPQEHLVAFASFGEDYPVYMYEYAKPESNRKRDQQHYMD